MTTETLKAITYITEVAVSEWPILDWVNMLNGLYKDGIPENAHFIEVINTYAEKFPNFEERAKESSQEAYDKLYDDFVKFIKGEK